METLLPLISSSGNSKVRLLRSLADRKHRAEQGLFLAEGVHLAEEAVASGTRPTVLLYAPDQVDRNDRSADAVGALAQIADLTLEATPSVVASVSDVQHGQGIVFAVPFYALHYRASQSGGAADRAAPLGLVLDAVADPGNMGTLLRTARAAGWTPILTPGTTDPYSPKVVRSAAGAHFWVGPLHQQSEMALVAACGRYRQVLLADVDGDVPYDAVDWTLPSALIIAGETRGARPESRRLATGSVRIPMPGGGDSLNVGAAAAIICFEAARQRARAAAPPPERRPADQSSRRSEPRAHPRR